MNDDKKFHRPQVLIYFPLCCVSFLLLFLTGGFTDVVSAENKHPVHFFSSETNINNFISLKTEFDTYLSQFGSYEFHPFNNRNIFEQQIKGQSDIIMLISSWHFQLLQKDYPAIPLLVGLRDGKSAQKRFLVINEQLFSNPLENLAPVASASSISHTKSVLSVMFNKAQQVESMRILPVPKDVDALMSVGFQMSRSALVTEHSLQYLATVDPVLHKKLKTKTEGVESLLLILAVSKTTSDASRKLVEIIQQMPDSDNGLKLLKMLDLDGWKQIDSSDKVKLED